jgi:predicted small lipoprotein YifL
MRSAALILIALLAGCGQKGPLTLPDKNPGGVVTRPAQTPADDAQDKKEKKDESDKKP